jgi:peptidoglycan biosynthesis protein MviN/MurJ (putative lipid II flippase)
MSQLWLTLVLTCVIFGYAGNFYAKKTGRDPLRWTILGVLLNVLILAAMVIAGGQSAKAGQYTR